MGNGALLSIQLSQAVLTAATLPSASNALATASAVSSHTWNGSAPVPLPAMDPLPDHAHAVPVVPAIPAMPNAAPRVSTFLLLRFSMYLSASLVGVVAIPSPARGCSPPPVDSLGRSDFSLT